MDLILNQSIYNLYYFFFQRSFFLLTNLNVETDIVALHGPKFKYFNFAIETEKEIW